MSERKRPDGLGRGADLFSDDRSEFYHQRTTAATRGGRPRRSRPADFEQRFIELGWELTPVHYGVHHRSIHRWLDECGKDRLIAARSAFVRAAREAARCQTFRRAA
jgi:hypothetical protein